MQIRIRQYTFTLHAPFAPGHRLSEGEADALNGLRAENIRNNMSRVVLDEIGALPPGRLLSEAQLADLQARISEYEAKYQFAPRHKPGPRPGDVEAEAEGLAREIAEAEGQGRETAWTHAEWLARVTELARSPEVQARARARLGAKLEIAQAALAELL